MTDGISRRVLVTVHPHGRGDNKGYVMGDCASGRFTPTGVGTIQLPRSIRFKQSVHPHGRGDNSICYC